MTSTSTLNHPIPSSALTTATAAQAAAAAVGREMKNFSDTEINELLGLIPDEYTAQQEAEEAAAAIAAANAASALGKGVHHSVTATATAVPPESSVGNRTPASTLLASTLTEEQETNAGVNGGSTSVEQKAKDPHITAQEAQLRSERKRSREKQRRNDVNKQFTELTEVLKNIEREAQEVGRNDDAYGSVSTMMAIATSTGPTNRVDLIARTIIHLERLNRTAKKQRLEIASLRQRLEHTKKTGEEMAEKLKDVMFDQQRQFSTAAYAPFPHLTPPSAQAAPVPTASVSRMSSMPATNVLQQQQHLQQQMPMMMMPMMMHQSTSQAPNTSVAPVGASGSAGAPGVAAIQQPQQQFVMVMHPGGQMTMAGQPIQQIIQPVAAIPQQQQQQQQPAVQQQHQIQQQHQQQTHVQQQQQQVQQQHQPIAPATQSKATQGSSIGGVGSNMGENFAHAA